LTKDAKAESRWGTGGPGHHVKRSSMTVRMCAGAFHGPLPESRFGGQPVFHLPGEREFLDRQYTAFGKLIKGDDVLGKIGETPTTASGGGERSKPLSRVAWRA